MTIVVITITIRYMKSGLRDEIKQSRPFTSLEEEVFLALQLTACKAMSPWTSFLKTHASLTPAQYNMLRILRGAHPEGLTCTEISERLINKDPDVTRMVDRLEKQSLVRRERSLRDRRVITVRITKEGLSMLKKLDQEAGRMPKELLGKLGKRRLQELRNLLAAVREAVQ